MNDEQKVPLYGPDEDALTEVERHIREAARLNVKPLIEAAKQDELSVLNRREKTHGPFAGTALTEGELCRVMETTPNWRTLTDMQRYALKQNAVKMARILNGDPNFPDHWADIAGHAILVVRNLP